MYSISLIILKFHCLFAISSSKTDGRFFCMTLFKKNNKKREIDEIMSDSDDSSDNSYHEEEEQAESGGEGSGSGDDSGKEPAGVGSGDDNSGKEEPAEEGEEQPHQGPPQKPRVAGRKGTKRMLVRILFHSFITPQHMLQRAPPHVGGYVISLNAFCSGQKLVFR